KDKTIYVHVLRWYDDRILLPASPHKILAHQVLTGGDGTVEQTDDGVAIHTVFHLYHGQWLAEDTTIQYSYGISFGHRTGGRLRATRLKAGPRPDALIASGTADIELVDSQFPIALGIECDQGGRAELDLPVGEPISRVFDASNVPGIRYRMVLEHTVCQGHWFVFLRQILMDKPPCEIVLRDCPRCIVSLLTWNVQGELTIPRDLATPVRLGNTTIRRGDRPVDVFVWALYFGGDKTDVTVRGKADICELMHSGGIVRLIGTPATTDLRLGCTTTEVRNTARLELQNVHLGSRSEWKNDRSMGELNVSGEGIVTGRHVTAHRVTIRTRDSGSVRIQDFAGIGSIGQRPEGGSIELLNSPD
ncbi:MAG: hypothetical protein JJ992_01565, partial [Planctomycetes bacterium]|nr:hypothetical protein [Planctomycetota bacterium]